MTMSTSNDLAATIVTILAAAAPYLQEVAKGAAKEIGADGWRKAKEVYQRVRDRFKKDKNDKADQTLTLFLSDADTFESALSKLLLATLQQHPEWAEDVRQLLAGDGSLQEIIQRNNSHLERVKMSLTGRGTQRIDQNNSTATDIEMTQK